MARNTGRGRLNDTEALADAPFEGELSRTVSTRKIDNGYLTRTSEYNSQTGECRSSERFSRRPQTLPQSERSTLDETRDYMGKRGV